MLLNKKNATWILIIIAIVLVLGVKLYKSSQVKPVDSIAARSKGPVQAKVSIIEFIDFQCPACAYGYGILNSYSNKYAQDIHVQVKYFPLIRAHRHAIQSALYAECAARQGRFWDMADQIMANQAQWAELISAEGMFTDMAKNIGINLDQLHMCLKDETAKQSIDDDRLLGSSMNIQSTPTYFINNKMVVGSKDLIDELKIYFPEGS